MKDKHHQEAVKEAVKGRFRGSSALKSKVTPRYPESVEREFQRVSRKYVKLMHEALKEHLPTIMAEYKRERHGDSRLDDINDFKGRLQDEMHRIAEELEQKMSLFGLQEFIEKIAVMERKASIREWKRVVKETLGIDILDDYYNGEFYATELRKWVDENVRMIKSLPNEALDSIHQTILNGYLNGSSLRTVQQSIQKDYGVTKRKAVMIARDQLSTLNSQMAKLQQQDAGCDRYRWSDSRDSRVRDCHRELNGKIFSWNDPPEMWYYTQKSGKVMTGRRCHPGEDFCCRCVAIPVFDFEKIDVPMK